MIKVAVVGLGKMGLSHYAVVNAHPDVEVAGICDSSSYVLGVLKKYTGVTTYSDFDAMLDKADLDAVVIATPSSSHAKMVRAALERDLHVFCEKPFTLNPQDADALAALGDERGLVTQVGYHNRFIGAFQEVKRLLDAGAIGEVTHVLGEAYGPVVLKPKGGTWRSQRTEGGGCLYDYAAHVLDLVNWYVGEPVGVGGTALNSVFSREIDDEVFSTLYYPQGNDGPDLRQLVRRVLSQDDDPHHRLGHEGTNLRRPAGMPGVYPGYRDSSRRVRARLERALHHRADRAGVVLLAR